MSWPERFLALFCEIASPLAVILNAEGCREGWLQGEFYRYFSTPENGFRVNCSYLGDVLRLQRLPAALERYMILVLQKADEADPFGRVISTVQVSSREFEWESTDFLVRVSRL